MGNDDLVRYRAPDAGGGRSHTPHTATDLSFHGLAADAIPYSPGLYRLKTRDPRLCSTKLLCRRGLRGQD